jgi:hypothetical protein
MMQDAGCMIEESINLVTYYPAPFFCDHPHPYETKQVAR